MYIGANIVSVAYTLAFDVTAVLLYTSKEGARMSILTCGSLWLSHAPRVYQPARFKLSRISQSFYILKFPFTYRYFHFLEFLPLNPVWFIRKIEGRTEEKSGKIKNIYRIVHLTCILIRWMLRNVFGFIREKKLSDQMRNAGDMAAFHLLYKV